MMHVNLQRPYHRLRCFGFEVELRLCLRGKASPRQLERHKTVARNTMQQLWEILVY